MASFKSILGDIGHALEKVFTVATKVAVVAEPIVDFALPGIAGLYNSTVTEVVNAENAAIAAGAQSGTGAQKLATVVAAIEPSFNSYLLANGIPAQPATTIENWVNAVVAGLNAIPAASSTAAVIEKS
jgi:hypothetical protein